MCCAWCINPRLSGVRRAGDALHKLCSLDVIIIKAAVLRGARMFPRIRAVTRLPGAAEFAISAADNARITVI